MKPTSIILLTIIVLILSTCNKDLLEINRTAGSFSNASFITPINNFEAEDAVEDLDGGLLIVGNARSQDFAQPAPTILKLDEQRAVEWSKTLNLDEQGIYRAMRIIPTLDNEYTILTMSSPTGWANYNIDLTKINASGEVTWQKRLEESDKDVRPRAIVQLADGDYIVFSTVIIEEAGTVLEHDNNQLQLHRVSSQGELIWEKTIEDSTDYSAADMIYFPDDDSVIAMSVSSVPFIKEGKVDLYKFDLDGNELWKETTEREFPIYSKSSSLSKTGSDHFVVLFSAIDEDLSNTYHTVLMKMNLEANILWEQDLSTSNLDIAEGIIPTFEDGYLLLTQTSSFGNGGYDAMLSKLDANGEILWEKTYGSSASDQPNILLERTGGNFTVLGVTNQRSGLENVFDLMLFETDDQGNPL